MKKLIFLLLLAQTISFLYGDAGCLGSSPAHSYHGYNENPGDDWGMRIAAPQHTNCDCNCAQYARAKNKCINCGHINVPKALTLSSADHTHKKPSNTTQDKKKASKAIQKKDQKKKQAAKKKPKKDQKKNKDQAKLEQGAQ